MADTADLAGEIIETSLAIALARAQLPNTVATDPWCEECGEEIPQKRRLAAPWATTCINCQSVRERRGKHAAR
ncbi:TraR/DksA C4-type zinc finger protein [Billgrantia kenyensis]|uniref:TraR/DksA family transcriptional regulator n=1 Tax=Billgrantia kenyensis TaxID=321266 RepID=A0A7V9W4Y1_9GAMM|nr:TraR/DksA family transcriptional regulator [Halomonas kenyensis]MBA2781094.1 TraR/DksA family transcriptional regulator [Halomonas kenyensis]MCG6663807.1 TraR/DksA family transcriptional regulator [Halomonas kenyensis]